MLRWFTNRRALGALTVVAVLAGAGAAIAYFTSTGSGSGSASVGSTNGWSVTDSTAASTLYPGQGSESITAPTVAGGAPTVAGHPCGAADFALSATGGSGWTVAGDGLSATYSPASDLSPNGTYGYGGSGHALTLSMLDASYAQDNCQGATANVTEAAS
jgi:hypothetical protein